MQKAGLLRLQAKLVNGLFLIYEGIRSRLSSKRKLKILFSDVQGWKGFIEKGFRLTKHEIVFGVFSPDTLKAYDLVVPLTIEDLMYLNEARHLIADNPIPIPSADCIRLCDDKNLFNRALIANGFGSFIPKVGGAQAYPYILKKSIDGWGENSHIILDAQQEQTFSDALANPEYFTQAFIPGAYEYATHIVFRDHKIVCAINIEYVFETETPIKGKDQPIYTKICRCPYLDVFSSILISIGFEGLCCFNYKVYDNRLFILEINPRFGGSLCPFFCSFLRHIA